MEVLARIHVWLERISRAAVWAGGGALMACALMVTVDVILRKLFSITMSGSDEVSGYVFAASTAWAYSYCLIHRSHVRIDAAYNLFPRRVQVLLDALGLLLLLGYITYLTDKAMDVFLTSWQRDSVSITTLATPLWIPQFFWLVGLCLFVFTLSFLLFYVLVSLAVGDIATAQKVGGAMSARENIEEETHGMGTGGS